MSLERDRRPSWFLGAPLYFLWRHYNLLRGSVCSALGGAAGVFAFYDSAILREMEWHTVLWLGLSGSGAGAIFGPP